MFVAHTNRYYKIRHVKVFSHIFAPYINFLKTLPLVVLGLLVLRLAVCGMCVFSYPTKPWPRSKTNTGLSRSSKKIKKALCVCARMHVRVSVRAHVANEREGEEGNIPDALLASFLTHTLTKHVQTVAWQA